MATVKPVVKLTKEGLMPANNSVSIGGANGNEFKEVYAKTINATTISGTITDNNIKDNTISGNKISNKSIDSTKLVAGIIPTALPPTDNSVYTDSIQNGAITEVKIVNDAITTNKVKDKAITNDKIAENTITNDRLQNSTMTFSRGYQESNVALGETVQLYQIGSVIPDSLPEGMLFIQYEGAPSAPATPETAPDGQEDEPTEEPST